MPKPPSLVERNGLNSSARIKLFDMPWPWSAGSSSPASIIICGSGAIGTEFAYVLSNYGVKVTIVEFLDRMVPLEDPEISRELAKAYKKLGVDLILAGFLHFQEEIEYFGARVLPLVRELEAAELVRA